MNKFNNQSGFTLFETVVVLALVAIFSLFLVNIVLSSAKNQTTGNQIEQVRSQMMTIVTDLTQEVRSANSAEVLSNNISGSVLQVTVPSDQGEKEIIYQIEDQQLLKNDTPVTSEGILVESFSVEKLTIEAEVPLFVITVEISMRSNPEIRLKEEIKLSLRNRVLEK